MFKEGALMTRVNDGFGTIAHGPAAAVRDGKLLLKRNLVTVLVTFRQGKELRNYSYFSQALKRYG